MMGAIILHIPVTSYDKTSRQQQPIQPYLLFPPITHIDTGAKGNIIGKIKQIRQERGREENHKVKRRNYEDISAMEGCSYM